jgi:hypothetical protein
MAILRPLPERLSLESLANRWGYDLEKDGDVFIDDINSHMASNNLSLFTFYTDWAIEHKGDKLDHNAEIKNQRHKQTGKGRGGYINRFRFDELRSGARPVRMCEQVEICGLNRLDRYYDTKNKVRLRTHFGYFRIESRRYLPLKVEFSPGSLMEILNSGVSTKGRQKPDYSSSYFSLAVSSIDLDAILVLGVEIRRLEMNQPAKVSKEELWEEFGWYDDEMLDEDEQAEFKPELEQRLRVFDEWVKERGIEDVTNYKKDDIWEVLQERDPKLFEKGDYEFFKALNKRGIKFPPGRKNNSYIPIADK